jgi:Ca2+-binding RTX toxin-like protein
MPTPLPTFDPANFPAVPVIDNPLFPLQPGTTYTYESPPGSAEAVVGTFTVTRETINILGVTCVVVAHIETVDGVLVEKTKDYFAQDTSGNVWYLGEDVKNFEDGKFVDTEGTWRAGVDNATAGFIMLADPQVGDSYDQEHAPDVALDHADVVSINGLIPPADVPYGPDPFTKGLDTLESTPLEPGVFEHKIYAPGVGLVAVTGADPAEILEQLVKIRVDGTSKADKLFGYAGGDEINGNGGEDHLDGWLGSDTIKGGSGDDLIEGGGKDRFDGGDDHAADYLYGGSGKDTILVGNADHAFGGAGNDLMHLLDNTAFAEIDGGSQQCRNVGRNAGDILQFDGDLDLTAPGLSERITGIETLSMNDDKGGDSLVLSAQDVLDLGSGTFDPRLGCHDALGKGDALRIDGDQGDELTLSGNWTALDPKNGPDDFDVFACHAPTGDGNVYVLVQEDIAVTITAAA